MGQLTAGIAHEIKNTLNFVINFSELSVELVDEARDEIRRGSEDERPESEKVKVNLLRQDFGGQESETKDSPFLKGDTGECLSANEQGESEENQDTDLILNDIEANLKTIHKHGSRADSIVKSMLQHSRGSDGTIEPTPLNPIIKEYVNLAFHGIRAGKESINVDIELYLDESIGEVPLIAEDFSRVILNLVNNAFDAMREKMTGDGGPKTGESYHPKLTVRTKSEGSNITIKVEDNGPGIPEEMKDKILQPFFTTKKWTAGTGLELSITNDIIKAHGGTLEIDSSEGKTIFSITLQNNL